MLEGRAQKTFDTGNSLDVYCVDIFEVDTIVKCALCRDEISGEPVIYKGKSYCCEACAFDASLRLGSMCGSQSTVEAGRQFERSRAASGHGNKASPGCRAIAIDGPVAVGKSSVGRLLARRLGYLFVDTGAMYRALTLKALQLGIDPQDELRLIELAGRTEIRLEPSPDSRTGYRVLLDGVDATEEIRSPRVESAVSFVSRIPGVRRSLVEMQRGIAAEGRVVMAGRDIATVVLPQAGIKIFLNASAEERARRRYQELKDSGKPADLESVLAELCTRDSLDSTRKDSPLRPDTASVVVDTDRMGLDQVVDAIYAIARERGCP